MSFEQAAIKIEKQQEFAKLQAAVEQAFLPERVERFLKQLDRKGIRVREFDGVLSARLLEEELCTCNLLGRAYREQPASAETVGAA